MVHYEPTCIKRMREALLMAARMIEKESELYRDGDSYQPHGVSLRKVSAECRRAAAKEFT